MQIRCERDWQTLSSLLMLADSVSPPAPGLDKYRAMFLGSSARSLLVKAEPGSGFSDGATQIK